MKYYRVSSELAMNLGSMITFVEGLAYDFRDGKVSQKITCCGRTLSSEGDCWDFHEDLMKLPCYGMVATSEEYGMLVQIKRERTHSRNMANLRRA